MYSSIDPKSNALAMSFCQEAERLWKVERSNNRDTITNIAAAEFLCLGYLGQGRDHAILAYVHEASKMGQRMKLFGVESQHDSARSSLGTDTVDKPTRARMYAAWGVFNWITLVFLLIIPRPLCKILIGSCTNHKGSCRYSIVNQAYCAQNTHHIFLFRNVPNRLRWNTWVRPFPTYVAFGPFCMR